MQKLIIDTDPGQDIDDLLALSFALRRPELDIRAITTVTLPADRRARLVRRLLRYHDRTDIPVGTGMAFPLRALGEAEIRAQYDFRQTMNHYAFAEPEDPRDDPGAQDAVDLIIRTVEQHPGEVAPGLHRAPDEYRLRPAAPAGTGRADPLHRHDGRGDGAEPGRAQCGVRPGRRRDRPDFRDSDHHGHVGRHPAGGCCPWTTASGCAGIRPRSIRRWRGAIDLWHPAQSWKPGPVMYDLFPVVWAFAPAHYATAPMGVRVETRGEFTRGMTVPHGGEPKIAVTTEVRAAEVRELFLETLLA